MKKKIIISAVFSLLFLQGNIKSEKANYNYREGITPCTVINEQNTNGVSVIAYLKFVFDDYSELSEVELLSSPSTQRVLTNIVNVKYIYIYDYMHEDYIPANEGQKYYTDENSSYRKQIDAIDFLDGFINQITISDAQ